MEMLKNLIQEKFYFSGFTLFALGVTATSPNVTIEEVKAGIKALLDSGYLVKVQDRMLGGVYMTKRESITRLKIIAIFKDYGVDVDSQEDIEKALFGAVMEKRLLRITKILIERRLLSNNDIKGA